MKLQLLAWLMLCVTVGQLWNAAQHSRGRDFYQFWVVGQVLLSHQSDIYSNEARERIGKEFLEKVAPSVPRQPRQYAAAKIRSTLETFSTPFLYAGYGLIASGDYERDYQSYTVLCLASGTAALLVISRILGYGSLASVVTAALLLEWFDPIHSDIRVGNVNQLQLGLLALLLWLLHRPAGRRRDLAAGFVLGSAVMFKPNTALVVATLSFSWLANHRFRQLAHVWSGLLVAVLLAFGLSSTLAGSVACWTRWFAAVRTLPESIITLDLGNYSFTELLRESTGIDVRLPFTLAIVTVTVFSIWSSRSPIEHSQGTESPCFVEDLMVGLGCVLYLLCARLVWIHYLTLAIPLALTLLRPTSLTERSAFLPIVAGLAICLIGRAPAAILLQSDEPHRLAALAALGLLLLFILAIGELWRRRWESSRSRSGRAAISLRAVHQ